MENKAIILIAILMIAQLGLSFFNYGSWGELKRQMDSLDSTLTVISTNVDSSLAQTISAREKLQDAIVGLDSTRKDLLGVREDIQNSIGKLNERVSELARKRAVLDRKIRVILDRFPEKKFIEPAPIQVGGS